MPSCSTFRQQPEASCSHTYASVTKQYCILINQCHSKGWEGDCNSGVTWTCVVRLSSYKLTGLVREINTHLCSTRGLVSYLSNIWMVIVECWVEVGIIQHKHVCGTCPYFSTTLVQNLAEENVLCQNIIIYYINLIYKRAQWSANPESQANKIQGNCYSKTEGFSTCTAALVGYVVSLPLVEEWSIVMSMSVCKHIFRTTSWWLGVVVSGVRCMNEVNTRRAQLVPGWVTFFRRVYNLGM